MADKQIEIEVVAKTDTSEVEALEEVIDQLKSDASEEISLSVSTDELESDLSDASGSVEDLESELEAVNDTVVAPQVDTSGIDDLTQKTEESASALDSATTALVGISATAGLEEMVSTADRINTSWNRLELTFAGTGTSLDELKTKTSSLSQATGRSGGLIRDYFNQMGIAGVTNTDLISESFEALSGKAYQTGNSIESMETKMQTMAMTGNASGRMLRSLGISAEDLAQAMGVSADEVSEAFKNLTPEERIQAITQAMGDGAEANEMYKDSYAGLKDQADAAMAGLMGAIGQAILPVVVPALQAATDAIKFLSDGFKNLPEPVQGIIGAIAGFAAIATTLIGVLGTAGQVFKMVKGGFEALGLVSKLGPIFSWFGTAASSLWGILIANPIILVVVAIIALVAALVWAYYNVDWFREMVDNAWASLMQFAQQIWSAVQPAIQFLSTLFNQFTSQLGLNTKDWIQAVLAFILFMPTLPARLAVVLANAIARALGFGDNFTQTMINGAMNAVNGFINWISQLPGKLKGELDAMLQMASDFVVQIANLLTGGAAGMVIGWITGSGESSPGYMYDAFVGELQAMREAPKKYLGGLSSDMRSIGAGLDSGFIMDMEFANASVVGNGSITGGQVNNFYFSDVVVDNDERMEKIVDYVRREIAWNNVTAGRTV